MHQRSLDWLQHNRHPAKVTCKQENRASQPGFCVSKALPRRDILLGRPIIAEGLLASLTTDKKTVPASNKHLKLLCRSQSTPEAPTSLCQKVARRRRSRTRKREPDIPEERTLFVSGRSTVTGQSSCSGLQHKGRLLFSLPVSIVNGMVSSAGAAQNRVKVCISFTANTMIGRRQ